SGASRGRDRVDRLGSPGRPGIAAQHPPTVRCWQAISPATSPPNTAPSELRIKGEGDAAEAIVGARLDAIRVDVDEEAGKPLHERLLLDEVLLRDRAMGRQD